MPTLAPLPTLGKGRKEAGRPGRNHVSAPPFGSGKGIRGPAFSRRVREDRFAGARPVT